MTDDEQPPMTKPCAACGCPVPDAVPAHAIGGKPWCDSLLCYVELSAQVAEERGDDETALDLRRRLRRWKERLATGSLQGGKDETMKGSKKRRYLDEVLEDGVTFDGVRRDNMVVGQTEAATHLLRVAIGLLDERALELRRQGTQDWFPDKELCRLACVVAMQFEQDHGRRRVKGADRLMPPYRYALHYALDLYLEEFEMEYDRSSFVDLVVTTLHDPDPGGAPGLIRWYRERANAVHALMHSVKPVSEPSPHRGARQTRAERLLSAISKRPTRRFFGHALQGWLAKVAYDAVLERCADGHTESHQESSEDPPTEEAAELTSMSIPAFVAWLAEGASLVAVEAYEQHHPSPAAEDYDRKVATLDWYCDACGLCWGGDWGGSWGTNCPGCGSERRPWIEPMYARDAKPSTPAPDDEDGGDSSVCVSCGHAWNGAGPCPECGALKTTVLIGGTKDAAAQNENETTGKEDNQARGDEEDPPGSAPGTD